jgi:FecR-like protein
MRPRTALPVYIDCLLMLLLALAAPLARAEPAGQVMFAVSGVVAVDLQGNRRALQKNDPVHEGDTLLTNDGRIQIRFKDGAFVGLQPQTRFVVERYRYTAAGDAEDGVIMSLLKGGLRTISGLVGKQDRTRYSMKTAVATIGIRGTNYALDLNDKLVGSVSEGAIEVCNGAGCVSVLAGQGFLVPSLTDLPALSDQHVFLPPVQPRAARTEEVREVADGTDSQQKTADRAATDGEPTHGAAKSHTASPSADAASAIGPNSTGRLGAEGNSSTAAGGAPGQVKKADLNDTLLVLPPPASGTTPPGQLKKLDSSPLEAMTQGQGKGVVPPGQAKKADVGDIFPVLPPPAMGTTPPGQLKKLDASPLEAMIPGQGQGVGPPGGVPPGQAKR